MSSARKEWIRNKRDCTIDVVPGVRTAISISFYSHEICGDGFGDISANSRGGYKMRIAQTLLHISQLALLGTNTDPDGQPLPPSFMYKGAMPKVEVFYEVLRYVSGTKAGFRLIFAVHDPAFYFGNGVILTQAMNFAEMQKLCQNARAAMAAKRRAALGEEEPCGTEYKELISLDVWRKWLYGMFIDKGDAMDLSTVDVYNREIQLNSFRNPANPQTVLSLQGDTDGSRLPAELQQQIKRTGNSMRPEQLCWNSYRRDAAPGRNIHTDAPTLDVPGVDEGLAMTDSEGDMYDLFREPRRATAAPPSFQITDDAAGGWVMSFPYPTDVFYIGTGPDANPEYIYQHLRPDVCQERRAIAQLRVEEPTMQIQETVLACADDETMQGILRGLEHLRLDMRDSPDSKLASGLMECLAKTDHILSMRLANLKELETLNAMIPDTDIVKREKIQAWKSVKLMEFIDYFKNGDPNKMNPNTRAISRYYKETLDAHGTLVRHRVCADPTLSMFANCMATFRSASDKILQIYTAHPVVELCYLCCLDAYRFTFGLGSNMMMPGDQATSKTFTMSSIRDHLLIPGTMDMRTRDTLRAGQTEGDQNGSIVGFDEAPREMLDLNEKGGAAPTDPVQKSLATSAYMKIRRVVSLPDGRMVTQELYIPCRQTIVMAFNEKMHQISGPWKSRFLVVPMPEDKRDDDDLTKEDVFHGMWDKDPDLVKNMHHFFYNMQLFVFLVETMIKLGLMKDVDTTIAKHWAKRCKEQILSAGLDFESRDSERLVSQMRTCAIINAVYTLFVSELGAYYKSRPWDPNFLFDVEPLLAVTDEIAAYVIGLHSLALVPFDNERLLRTTLRAAGATMPKEDENGVIQNADDVEWRNLGARDVRKENAYDYVMLKGAEEEIATKVCLLIDHPKPPKAVVLKFFHKLKESMISVRNRDENGAIIREMPTGQPRPAPQISQSAHFVHPGALPGVSAPPAPPPPSGQQGQLHGFRTCERPGTHEIKGMHIEVINGQKVMFLPTDLVLKPPSYKGIVDRIIASACHPYTRKHAILVGLPHVEYPKNGPPRRYPYLIQRSELKPGGNVIILRKPFETDGVASILYADTHMTSYYKNPRNRTAVMIIETDWETQLFIDRMKTLPREIIERTYQCVPSEAETVLPALHARPDFRAQCCVQPLKYPDDIIVRVKEQEQLMKRVLAGDLSAYEDQRVQRCTQDGFLQSFRAREDRLLDLLPANYMRGAILQDTRNFPRRSHTVAELTTPPRTEAPPEMRTHDMAGYRDRARSRKKTKRARPDRDVMCEEPQISEVATMLDYPPLSASSTSPDDAMLKSRHQVGAQSDEDSNLWMLDNSV